MIERERDVVTKVKDKLCWQAPDGSITYIGDTDELSEVLSGQPSQAEVDLVHARLDMKHLINDLDKIAEKHGRGVRVAGGSSAVSFVYDLTTQLDAALREVEKLKPRHIMLQRIEELLGEAEEWDHEEDCMM